MYIISSVNQAPYTDDEAQLSQNEIFVVVVELTLFMFSSTTHQTAGNITYSMTVTR